MTQRKSLESLPDYDDQEDMDGFNEEGAGSYFAVGMGILIDEKIDYTIDGINYAIDAVAAGFSAVAGAVTGGCGYEPDKTQGELDGTYEKPAKQPDYV